MREKRIRDSSHNYPHTGACDTTSADTTFSRAMSFEKNDGQHQSQEVPGNPLRDTNPGPAPFFDQEDVVCTSSNTNPLEHFRVLKMKRQRSMSEEEQEGAYKKGKAHPTQEPATRTSAPVHGFHPSPLIEPPRMNENHASLLQSDIIEERKEQIQAASDVVITPRSAVLNKKKAVRQETVNTNASRILLSPRSQMHEDGLLLLNLAGVLDTGRMLATQDTHPAAGKQTGSEKQDGGAGESGDNNASPHSHNYVKFQDRIAQLKAFKVKHGHLRVTAKLDKNLHSYCNNVKYARRNPDGAIKMRISDERIKALDKLGFNWESSRSPRDPRSNPRGPRPANPNMRFELRIDQLRAFKEKHGHLQVKKAHDKSLYSFCMNVRSASRRPGVGVRLSDDRLKLLNDLGFEWNVTKKAHVVDKTESQSQSPKDVPTSSSSKKGVSRTFLSFEERVEQLKEFKEKFGNVKVTRSYDKSLYAFCTNIRAGRRNPGAGMKVTDERVKVLDVLGFEWSVKKSVDQVEQKPISSISISIPAKNSSPAAVTDAATMSPFNSSPTNGCGDLLPPQSSDTVLSIKKAQKALVTDVAKSSPPIIVKSEEVPIAPKKETVGGQTYGETTRKILQEGTSDSDERNKQAKKINKVPSTCNSLPKSTSPPKKRIVVQFEARIQQLKAFKEKHGHLLVKARHDKNLHTFCNNVRNSRRKPGRVGIKLTDERIKSLDDIGFEWNPCQRKRIQFQERIEQLAVFKVKHGHVDVKVSHDKSLNAFCNNARASRRNPGANGMKMTEDRVKTLNDLGFEWKIVNEAESLKEASVKSPAPLQGGITNTKREEHIPSASTERKEEEKVIALKTEDANPELCEEASPSTNGIDVAVSSELNKGTEFSNTDLQSEKQMNDTNNPNEEPNAGRDYADAPLPADTIAAPAIPQSENRIEGLIQLTQIMEKDHSSTSRNLTSD